MSTQVRLSVIILFVAVFCFLNGCNSAHQIRYPPPYLGYPQEISIHEVKGLGSAKTVSFRGKFAEELINKYAYKNHYKYYVVITRGGFINDRLKPTVCMMYK